MYHVIIPDPLQASITFLRFSAVRLIYIYRNRLELHNKEMRL
jgi:hypothetical protein